MGQLLLVLVALGGATYLALGVALYALQDRLVFPAPGGIDRASLDAAAGEVGARPVDLVAADGTPLYAWHLVSRGERLVLMLTGNGETVASYVPLYRLLNRNGWDVLVLAYRGYPGSGGAPSEAGLGMDAQAAWDWAVARYRPERVVVHGRSLGGGVAAMLVAGEANPAGLVLESTFTSVRDLAKRTAPLYPVDLLLRSPFDTRSRAPGLGVPVLLMHSSDDRVIPPDLGGRSLQHVIAEVQYEEVAGLSHQQCLPLADPKLRKVYLGFLESRVPR
ncbi:MAG: alpha/beta hydrolase [Bryobacterales bacterium]